jgi:hypothetical protein
MNLSGAVVQEHRRSIPYNIRTLTPVPSTPYSQQTLTPNKSFLPLLLLFLVLPLTSSVHPFHCLRAPVLPNRRKNSFRLLRTVPHH